MKTTTQMTAEQIGRTAAKGWMMSATDAEAEAGLSDRDVETTVLGFCATDGRILTALELEEAVDGWKCQMVDG